MTVAILVLLDFQVTFLLLAFDGKTVALSLYVFPLTSDKLVLLSFTLFTGISIVTLQVFTNEPSTVFTVIVATPGPLAMTFPVWETVATLALLEVHISALFEALDGITFAVS